MSELATLARPYAAAVFKRAKETNTISKWSETLAFIGAVLSDESISGIVNNPKFSNQQVSKLILSISDGQLDKEGENLLELLIHNKRLVLVHSVAEIFEAYKAEYEGYIDVDVQTAYPFTDDVEQHLINALEKSLSKKVNIKVTVDASLIGGVLVRAGDRVIDGSIKGQLQHMQKALQ
ncbi:MAG: F0F1 ATP synthase subunit delta [Methylococcaceae bacterium]|jgi:F-type H+-transporting ATPase subunit delta|nr:F0F1 ATP synthase subunit delta [Methylococcaceae bacterium]MDZ4157531.1 F0F1 ATP synthase subunit delta [Methylococcales bacterium]MDP2394893.1 F0F1 ATP synthase subunit delta [Methylococcaceae bacterium]MDP3019360.1 F0F1 ATP synthase subunit delta [Methylococcaceae bacterium]MDP3389045.1 F0F1 ATP synthase subunit delta [Methylococcaceae bacterium]